MKIFVVGAQGRMGLEIQRWIKKNPKYTFAGGLARQQKGSIVTDFAEIKVKPHILIDFSSPELFRRALAWSVKNRVPFLSGTTGLSSKDFTALKKASQQIPVLWTANTSLGIQILKNLILQLPQLDSFQLQLTEWHHVLKKDKPSGTALVLQNLLSQKKKKCPPPKSIRKGHIVGTHRIEIFSKEESLILEHVAHQRCVFAKGAICAAVWLRQQSPGLYNMEDYVHALSSFR